MNKIEQALYDWSRIKAENGEFNVLIGDMSLEDIELFFGPIYDFDDFAHYDDIKMPVLLKQLGFFNSNGQARKAGWKDEIPFGWSSYTIGKKRKELHILKLEK